MCTRRDHSSCDDGHDGAAAVAAADGVDEGSC